jgi:hypothetical protein
MGGAVMNEVAEVVRIKFAKLTVLAVVDIISLGPVLVDVLSPAISMSSSV